MSYALYFRALNGYLDVLTSHDATSTFVKAMYRNLIVFHNFAGSVNLSQFDGETAVSGSNFASTVASASVANGGFGVGGYQIGDVSPSIPASQIRA